MLKLSLTSLAAIVLLAASPVSAAPASAIQETVAVRIGDLDLATPSGTDRLQRRVRSAANEICGTIPAMPLSLRTVSQACHEEVVASSKAQVALATARAESHVQLARRAR